MIGLHVVVNINQDQNIKSVEESAGLRVLVTSQNKMPFTEEEGLHIQPGQVTSMGIRQVGINVEDSMVSIVLKGDHRDTAKASHYEISIIIHMVNIQGWFFRQSFIMFH